MGAPIGKALRQGDDYADAHAPHNREDQDVSGLLKA